MRYGKLACLIAAIGGLCAAPAAAQDASSEPDGDRLELFAELPPVTAKDLAEYQAEATGCFPDVPERRIEYAQGVFSTSERNECRVKLGLPPIYQGVGGEPVSISQVPFQVQIRFSRGAAVLPEFLGPAYRGRPWWQNRHMCGGALIDREWVLTAAHCFTYARNHIMAQSMMEVVAGTANIAGEAGVVMQVDRVVIKQGFNPGTLNRNDIALVHLVQGSAARNLQPASPDRPQLASARAARTDLFMNGWGTKAVGNPPVPVAGLQQFRVYPLTEPECRNLAGYGNETRNGITTQQIHGGVLCARARNVKTCKGDSGGPLFAPDPRTRLPVIVGIVSWTLDLCQQGDWEHPGVYTKVAPLANWIQRVISQRPAGREMFIVR